jgi:hypothetical protein
MKPEWDFRELVKFTQGLGGYEGETSLMTITQNIARQLHQTLLIKTPVKTGNLRKMWSAGDNLLFDVVKVPGGYEVTLINTAQNGKDGFMYGVAVNDGHKTPSGTGWVEGRFFVEASIGVTREQVEQIVMDELRKLWRRV